MTLLGFLLYFFVFPTSPRELVTKGKFDRARVTFSKIARWNGTPELTARFKN